MPAPVPGTVPTSGALYDLEPWATLDDYRQWANGGAGVLEGDFDDVRGEHLPRPQLYGFPNYAMLGELQDVRGASHVGGHAPWRQIDLPHRQIIMGDCLDAAGRCRVLGLMARFRMPLYGRASIHASFTHTLFSSDPFATNDTGSQVPYFSMWWGAAQGNTFTEFSGTRRCTRRWAENLSNHNADNFRAIEPNSNFSAMVGALSTKNTASHQVTGGQDVLVFVQLSVPSGGGCYFATGFGSGANPNRNRVEIHNAALVVRVWKNVLD